MTPALRISNLTKSFRGARVLDAVSFGVGRGEVHAVVGENGAGKSTLMKILAGIHRPDSGSVEGAESGVSMIHQELLLFPDLDVAENIWMGREPVRRIPGLVDRKAMASGATRLLARLGVTLDLRRKMRELTVSEIQTVEIAKALAREAGIFIMDEPTSALSARETESLIAIIADLKRGGATILYVSHRLEEIFRIADTITVLRDGRHVTTQPAREFDNRRLMALMVGREMAGRAAAEPRQPGAPVLEVRGLARAGRFRDVSFQLRRGEILGLGGLMGAGRTDVAMAIYGLAPADAGEILVDGRAVRIASPAQAIAHGIAIVTEDRKLYGIVPDLGVKENLTLAALHRCSRGPLLRRGLEREIAAGLVGRFRIRATGEDARAGALSGGNQQKIVIARALLTEPSVLILDEPTRGIDVGAKAEIHDMIRDLAARDKAVLLISSEMEELLQLADRVLVMREGGVTAELPVAGTHPEEILAHAMPV